MAALTPWIDVGAARRAMPGELECGDDYVVRQGPEAVLLAVVDGLGHGAVAAEAATVAVRSVDECADRPLEQLVLACHRAMRRTRGGVMTIARLERSPEGALLSWVGVGNVDGVHLRSDGTRDRVLALGGIVGYSIPHLLTRTVPVRPGEIVALATDGVRHAFVEGLADPRACQALADRLLVEHANPDDDACIVVARLVGAA